MKLRKSLCMAACLAIAGSQAMGADPETPTPGSRVVVVQNTPQTPQAPTRPTAPPPMVAPGTTAPMPVPSSMAPTTDAFVQAPAAGTSAPVSSVPNVIGDFIGGGGALSHHVSSHGGGVSRLPIISRGAFKIAEDQSPRPTDRVYFDYNYYKDVQPNKASISGDLHREVFGFEKTFLDGAASVGARLPLMQTDGRIGDDGFGDLTLIAKLALIDNRETGLLLSTGVAVTISTGDGIPTIDGTIKDTLIQPYIGVILSPSDSIFIQGFSSVAIPTDDRDVVLLFNSIAVGTYLFRSMDDSLIRYIAPALEAHVTTPLNHRGVEALVHYADTVSLIGGVHLGIGGNSTLSIAGGAPFTGPRPFDFEGIVQFNLRF